MKCVHVVFEICDQTDIQTDRHTDTQTDRQTETVIAIFCICISSEVTKQNGIERTML